MSSVGFRSLGLEQISGKTNMYFYLANPFWLSALLWLAAALPAAAQTADYTLGPSDIVRITVFDNPDMTTEVRVADNGKIHFPLIGEVAIGGLSTSDAESRIAELLRSGGFVLKPHVNVNILQYRSQQVSVIGQVNRPGRYPIEAPSKLSDMLAAAGGVNTSGSDDIVLIRNVDGRPTRTIVNQLTVFERGELGQNLGVQGGDVIFVPRALTFYIRGEVQRPGQYKLEPSMTVAQALSVGGGVTPRGTERGIQITRRDSHGRFSTETAALTDLVNPDDVLYIKERLF